MFLAFGERRAPNPRRARLALCTRKGCQRREKFPLSGRDARKVWGLTCLFLSILSKLVSTTAVRKVHFGSLNNTWFKFPRVCVCSGSFILKASGRALPCGALGPNYTEPRSQVAQSQVTQSQVAQSSEPSCTEPSCTEPSCTSQAHSCAEPSGTEPKWRRATWHRAKWRRAKWHSAKWRRAKWRRAKWRRAKWRRASGAEPSGTEPSGTEPKWHRAQWHKVG